MGRMWGKADDPVAQTLRTARPEASDELVGRLSGHVGANALRRQWSRVSFAAALTVFMLGTFISFGGLGYASSGVVGSVQVIEHVVMPVEHRVTYTSAADQYGKVKTVVKTVVKPTVKAKVLGSRATIKPNKAKAGSTLPFTGFSLLGTVVLGLSLVGFGLVLRRRERQS